MEMEGAPVNCQDSESRHKLTHELFRENPIHLDDINKVFCSQWISDSQVVFGTKCNKLMVYDVLTSLLEQIPSLIGRQDIYGCNQQQCGIHSVQVNPSRTLLATSAQNSCNIAIYNLPTLDPICIGENVHRDRVFDMCWLDDQSLVSGSRDTKMVLWQITPDITTEKHKTPIYQRVSPLDEKDCRNAERIRALAFNKNFKEIAALSLNGYIHIWNADTFTQKLSRELPSAQEDVCLAVQEDGLYAIGCRSDTLLVDCRTLEVVKEIPLPYSNCGIRSISFQGDILTIGTGWGMLLFYDLKAGKYLKSQNSSKSVVLKTSIGHVLHDEEHANHFSNVECRPAIYTHSYDSSGTRLFTAGGPLPVALKGNYAGLWQ